MLSSREKHFTLFAPKCMGGGGIAFTTYCLLTLRMRHTKIGKDVTRRRTKTDANP